MISLPSWQSRHFERSPRSEKSLSYVLSSIFDFLVILSPSGLVRSVAKDEDARSISTYNLRTTSRVRDSRYLISDI